MAWAELLPSGLYRGGYRDRAGRKQYTDAVRHKPRALREAAAAEEKARRTGRDLDAGRIRWGEWADQWLPTRRIEASTKRAEASRLRQVRERWDDVRLDEIEPMALRRWVRDLERRYSPSSVHKTFYLLAASLKDAQLDGLIESNPCRGIELPPLPPAEERYLEDVEVDRILYRLDGHYRMLAELLLATGMRLSEACGLHWHRVHLDAGTVDVIETWDKDSASMKAYPKGKKRRTVPLTPEAVELLVRWRDAHPDAGSCGRPHARYRAADARRRARGVDPVDRCRSSLVVPGPKGAPIDGQNFAKRQWARACAAAEVAGATPHALRHTYASRVLTRGRHLGVTIKDVQGLLGHSTIVTTERYAHLVDDGHDAIRAALSGGAAGGAERGAAVSGGVSPWRRPRAL